jgi:hypothetical protein
VNTCGTVDELERKGNTQAKAFQMVFKARELLKGHV